MKIVLYAYSFSYRSDLASTGYVRGSMSVISPNEPTAHDVAALVLRRAGYGGPALECQCRRPWEPADPYQDETASAASLCLSIAGNEAYSEEGRAAAETVALESLALLTPM